jgi:RNA polymerase sigma-70 factor (ECF subfamily)
MDRFVALYRAHLQFVWRVLWRARAPEADLNDLAHEVFVVVLRKLRAADSTIPASEDEERAWLYLIAIFELKNYRSRARFRRVEPMDDRTNEIPDARNDAAHLEAQEELRALLDTLPRDRREVFELVELEGVSVVAVARTLGITETNAHRRLALAREDIRAAAAKLAQRDRDAGTKKTSLLLLPFGVGAWIPLRDLANPPAGTADLIWKRLQDTMAAMDQENDRPARPPPQQPPARPRPGPVVKNLAGHLKRPLGYLLAAGVGGAIVAALFLLRPNAGIAILRVPVPVVVVASATEPLPAPLPAPSSSPAPATTDPIPTSAATTDDETQLMRQARAAYAAGNRLATTAALDAYERRFPAGQFRNSIREMRSTLTATDRR